MLLKVFYFVVFLNLFLVSRTTDGDCMTTLSDSDIVKTAVELKFVIRFWQLIWISTQCLQDLRQCLSCAFHISCNTKIHLTARSNLVHSLRFFFGVVFVESTDMTDNVQSSKRNTINFDSLALPSLRFGKKWVWQYFAGLRFAENVLTPKA